MIELALWYQDALRTQRQFLELALKVDSELKEAEASIAVNAALYAAEISPFWTGALSSAHTAEDVGDMHHVFLDPSVSNPLTGDHPADYGIEQHAIGGQKAFYDRTVEEKGEFLLNQGADDYLTRLEAIF